MPIFSSNKLLRGRGCGFSKQCLLKQLKRRLPITKWLPTMTLTSFLYDLAGGVTVGLTAIPQSLAYAQLASMPLENGLYTTIVSGFTYFLFGTARDVNLGPTSLVSLMTGSLVDETGLLTHQLLCFFGGIVMAIIAFMRLEVLLNIFPVTVTTGFTTAAAVIILGSQLKYFFGLPALPRPFVKLIPAFIREVHKTNTYDLIGGSLVLVFLLLIQYTTPVIMTKLARQRQTGCVRLTRACLTVFATLRAILAIVASATVAYYLSHHPMTSSSCHVTSNTTNSTCPPEVGLTLTGPVPRGLPRAEIPPFGGMHVPPTEQEILEAANSNRTAEGTFYSFGDLVSLVNMNFVIIPIVSIIELLAIGRALAQRNSYTVDASQEILTCGLAHFVGAFLNAYPNSSSITRSAINAQCNVKTQLCSFFTSLLVLIAAATIADITLPYVPKSCLAAVVIAAGLSMIEIHMFKMLWQVNRIDVLPAAITFFACLLMNIEYGILIGVVASLITSAILSMRSFKSKTVIKVSKLSRKCHRCMMITIPSGETRYPCADSIKKLWSRIVNHHGPVIVDCSQIREIDFSVMLALLHLGKHSASTSLSSRDYPLCFVGWNAELCKKVQNAIFVLKIAPPAYRSILFGETILSAIEVIEKAQQSNATFPDGFEKESSIIELQLNNTSMHDEDANNSIVQFSNFENGLAMELYDVKEESEHYELAAVSTPRNTPSDATNEQTEALLKRGRRRSL